MISKEIFVKAIESYQKFQEGIDRLTHAITGNTSSFDGLYDSDWVLAVDTMFDCFLQNNLTDSGIDLTYAYLFENCREFWVNVQEDLFNKEKQEHYSFDTLEELYDVMLKFKSDYFLIG